MQTCRLTQGRTPILPVYQAVLDYGDTVLGMDLSNGGHLSHGSPVNISGKSYNFVSYGLDPETEMIDFDNVRELALKHKPKADRGRRFGLPENYICR